MNGFASLIGKFGPVGWIALFVLAMGVLAWFFRPTSLFGAFMFLCVAIPVGIAIYWMYGVQTSAVAWEAFRQNGIAGSARVLKSESTHVRVNKQAQVRLLLSVQLPGEAPYEVTHVDVVPLGHAVGPGQQLSVYVDPKARERMIIDWSAMPTSAPEPAPSTQRDDIAARLAQLDTLHRSGRITDEEYQAQRQRILSEL